MNCKEADNSFDSFLDKRTSLITRYSEGDMSKKEFLEGNFDFLREMDVKPFKEIDSFEKGMYNYQYYNVMAKYYNMKALDARDSYSNKYNHYRDMRNRYYHEKDKSTMDFLKFLDFKDVEAYYVEMESDFLDDQIFEIVLLNYEKAIFHSKSYWLLKKLRDKEVFIRGKKKSIIDQYINEKY